MNKNVIKARIFAAGPKTGTKVLEVDRDTFDMICQNPGVEFEARWGDSILVTGTLLFGTKHSGKYYIVLDRASSEFNKEMQDLTHVCQILQRLNLPSIGDFRKKADKVVPLYLQHRKALGKITSFENASDEQIDEVNDTGEKYTERLQELKDCLNKMLTDLKRNNPEANRQIKRAAHQSAKVLDITRKYHKMHEVIAKELRYIFKKDKTMQKC